MNYIPIVASNQANSFYISDSTVPQMGLEQAFYEWPGLNIDTIAPQIYAFNGGNWFNNFFTGIQQTFTLTPQNAISLNSPKVTAERTPIEVKGIDYSIMGSDASKIKLLRPEMQRKVYQMFQYAKSKGWTLSITSAYRSTQKQTYLYNEWKAGRHKVPVVAKPGTSRHEFGCAVDISVSGHGASAEEMGKFGESIGLRWGGHWSRNRETWHFDLDPKKTADV
jgi:hypothetical protein